MKGNTIVSPMSQFDLLYKSLVDYLARLDVKFIADYIPADPSVLPSQYELDVRSYCVLSHAAFEDYVERIVLRVATDAVDNWLCKRLASDVALTLISWSGQRLQIDDNPATPEILCFDSLREMLKEAKSLFSKEVHNNHGVSKLYLRSMLSPVAIDLKSDANLLNSLALLSDGRGEYAHKGSVKSVMAPEDAQKYVGDVLTLCDDIRAKANKKIV